ncbi:helix-turn-helix transcriptional regulator [Sphingobium tyrosinilyticum]|uniref:Helix-turn-helix transcriptional regulator n=1 Tax=Sphingobium tyrosinilyticum TaxID=2715436 RepID=A0ABV9F0Z3_9SPHN
MTDEAGRLAEFSRLLLSLNTSLLSDDPWRDFLLILRDQTHARYGTLILTPPDPSLTTMITPTATSESIQRYLDRYLEIDPFVGLPEGKVVTLYEYVGEAALKNTTYYKEWVETMDGSHVLGVDLRMSGGYEARLRLTRAPGGEPFDREETRRVEEIVPHLRQAIELYQRLETSRSEQAVMIGAIEQFAVGTVILDHHLKVLKMNEVAASILADGDGIKLVGGRVALSNPARDAEFRRRLKEAVSASGTSGRSVFLAERPSGHRDIGIVVQPVQIPGFMHTGSAPAIALFLGDPERQCVVTSDAVRKLFNFTPTEAAISASLANGVSVIDTAHRLGIAENTVRAHLRSIFAKTGVARQSQLVHLIHTSLPELTLQRGG